MHLQLSKSMAIPQLGRVWVMALLLGLPLCAQAASVVAVSGEVRVQRDGKSALLAPAAHLREGDQIASATGGEALVQFEDGARMALRSDAIMSIKKLQLTGPVSKRGKTILVLRGGLRYISSQGSHLHPTTFETATAAIGIRGTDVEITVALEPVGADASGTYLKVNTGAASLVAVDGTQIDVAQGEVAFGGEPELVARGAGSKKRPAGRKLDAPTGQFKAGTLDHLLR